jgi:hypothetical protein
MGGGFGYLALGAMAVLIGGLLIVGHFYPGSGADVLDWDPSRRVEAEVQNELDDIAQMLEAQNERRRRRGLAERTLEDVELEVAGDLRERHRHADAASAAEAQETPEQVQEDLDSLLELHNERRARRGQPPLDLDELRAQLGV